MAETLLEITDLTKSFAVRSGFFSNSKLKNIALDRVNLSLSGGETLGLVGESGCGKSTFALTIMRLYEPDDGRIFFAGEDITHLDEKSLKPVRKQMQMVFQDPFASLDLRLTVEQIICEPLEIHNVGTKAERVAEVARLLERVGLSAEDMHRFPGEFSGGQQQRIGIARALVLRPKLLICDELVSALDVSVQAQILNLLRDLQDEFGLSYLFISHNIAITAFMSRRIGVMYLGRLVEIGDSSRIVNTPRHPYTQALLAAIPEPDPSKVNMEIVVKGDIEEIAQRPTGCVFRHRCPIAQEICASEEPQLRIIEENHQTACHFV
ncbi:MAG: ABC transporter ATP-binding protein [Acidobacteria bacterium]|nr:ABC transporter ATP-binding protein [Acidobacteriota bacterium]MCA1638655.1 ABC transporter ATP-binding protein [Acidobacteriota bacterium]